MQLLYCDESNLEEKSGDFLIYGGVAIDESQAVSLSAKIEEIRTKAKVDRKFDLKFNPGPPDLSHQQFLELKQEIIEAAIAHNVKLLVYAILHDISTNPDTARRYGINTVCYHFDCVLQRANTFGLVLIDRFNDKGNKVDGHLTEKFAVGVTGMRFSPEIRLTNILGFHYSAIGQSHFPSLVDILLGSLRFSFNAHTRNDEKLLETAKKLLGILSPLFHREEGREKVSELGFVLRPQEIKVEAYRQKYSALKEFMGSAGLTIAQMI
jgi:hypothetical protein